MNDFDKRLKIFAATADETVSLFRRGIEKESLRITPDGRLSGRPHPPSLGSPLTHPFVTTDYSEALIELVTPTFETVEQMLTHLKDLHKLVYRHIGNELLWVNSLPCLIGDDASIPIADFGTSNIGRMKRIYRSGLSLRYGRKMQIIAGIHYNFSVPDLFWKSLGMEVENISKDTVSNAYMAGTRNFHRHCWLLFYLFGASPAACNSFFEDQVKPADFIAADDHTTYAPYATSLRMSNVGYRNPVQSEIRIDHNSIEKYITTLCDTINTPYPAYEAFGTKANGEYLQLNTHLLQIENEYYSVIRPKRRTESMQKPTRALRDHGVEYLEIRCLDLDPFEPLGIAAAQAKFIETFLLFCLLEPSAPFQQVHCDIVSHNKDAAVLHGRDPKVKLRRNGQTTSIQAWGNEVIEKIARVAELIDRTLGGSSYTDSVQAQQLKLEHPDITPSAVILEHLRTKNEPFFAFALKQALRTKERLTKKALKPSQTAFFDQIAAQSIAEQKRIESADTEAFDTFLRNYFES